jgi:hypothetical protein
MTAEARSFTPAKLRLILSLTFGLILLAGAAIFYLAFTQLSKTAAETGEKVASARDSQNTLQKLRATRKELDDQRDVINKTAQITADSQNYAYQDRLINDLTIYASRAGMSISNISFSAQAGGVPAPATPTTPEAPMPTPGAGVGATPAVSGLRKATVDITLQNPVDYRNLLNFLHYIEQNIMKLKVSKVTLTKAEDNNVTTDILNLEVYIR